MQTDSVPVLQTSAHHLHLRRIRRNRWTVECEKMRGRGEKSHKLALTTALAAVSPEPRFSQLAKRLRLLSVQFSSWFSAAPSHRSDAHVSRIASERETGTAAPWMNFVAGVVATLVTRVALTPFDVVKTNLQYIKGQPGLPTLLPYRVGWVMRDIARRNGPAGFWSGLPAALLGGAPAQALYMTVYSACKVRLGASHPDASRGALLRVAAAAALADAMVALVRVPPEVVKQQLQTGQHRNTWAAVRALAQRPLHRGGFYQGFWAQVWRDVPFAVTLFVAYELLNRQAASRAARAQHTAQVGTDALAPPPSSSPVAWTSGAAGAIAALCTMPMDVARTRLMTRPPDEYRGVWHAMQRIAREDGVATLFAGTIPRILYKIPSASIFLTSFEATRTMLLRHHQRCNAGDATERYSPASVAQ
ncbi:hypothetical protein CDCA_CDCA01G0380 [Cyanidium caldarium]|uniref:Mitochondrial carrier protein n=1 Tax=Cyanidium caldarium TaxID=2771 RepID=A0AAV9IQJ7_CYACA|nr:hypothetical protein CDCA_CDCA01G0380 [Cyanidium caldarium]